MCTELAELADSPTLAFVVLRLAHARSLCDEAGRRRGRRPPRFGVASLRRRRSRLRPRRSSATHGASSSPDGSNAWWPPSGRQSSTHERRCLTGAPCGEAQRFGGATSSRRCPRTRSATLLWSVCLLAVGALRACAQTASGRHRQECHQWQQQQPSPRELSSARFVSRSFEKRWRAALDVAELPVSTGRRPQQRTRSFGGHPVAELTEALRLWIRENAEADVTFRA